MALKSPEHKTHPQPYVHQSYSGSVLALPITLVSIRMIAKRNITMIGM